MEQPRSSDQQMTGELAQSRRIIIYGWVGAVAWTLLLACSLAWNFREYHRELHEVARAEARAAFGRDVLYRRWASARGGVYVLASDKSPPNPLLAHVPERDITTPAGKHLTLINPAYMLRQVYEIARGQENIGRGHITSLKPLRPENLPDSWEEKALRVFENGVREVSEVQVLDGQEYMRLMRPFVTEKSCLKCHAIQGYQEDDIRGGISVSIPITELKKAMRGQLAGSGVAHGVIWILGLSVYGVGARKLFLSALTQQRTEMELHEQALQLEQEIGERQMAQETLEEQAAILEEEITERQSIQDELAFRQQQLETLNRSLEQRIAETVEELRRKDQLLIQQNRLAAMGEMIHNIAHQWRQPLNNVGLIVQNLWLSAESGELDKDELKEEVDGAMDIIMHMSSTIDDFRNFFRADKEKRNFTINKVLATSLEFLAASLESSNIRVEVEADDTVIANGYQNEYGQAVLNIVDNARDVLLERNIATPLITIRVAHENGRSVLTVRDNAGGISDDVLPRIFDPYFTTKGPNKGTGIGLYMTKVIVEQHMDGVLSARNVDGGAEFRIEV